MSVSNTRRSAAERTEYRRQRAVSLVGRVGPDGGHLEAARACVDHLAAEMARLERYIDGLSVLDDEVNAAVTSACDRIILAADLVGRKIGMRKKR